MLSENLSEITFTVITEIVPNNFQYCEMIHSKYFLTQSLNSLQTGLNFGI